VARIERALAQTGDWLQRFQRNVPPNAAAPRDLREYVDVRLRRLSAGGFAGFTHRHRAVILSALDSLLAAAAAGDLRMRAMHGDLCPSNILVHDDGVTVLDLAMSSDGPRFHDLAHLYMHVGLCGRHLRLGTRVTARLQARLLDGYGAAGASTNAAFRASLLQHAACWMMDAADRVGGSGHYVREFHFSRYVARAFAVAGLASPDSAPVF
jgi:Ser/Thr protein kinase RdoA (MazF antagonist)